MTVSSLTNRVDFTGSGIVGPYSYPFRIRAATDLTVTKRETATGLETTLTYPGDFSVTGVGVRNGGLVTLTQVLPSGYTLAIRRTPSIKQLTNIRNQGSYFPETIEDALDNAVTIDQMQQDAVDRSLKLPSTLDPADFTMTLPTPAASKALVWNVAGDGFDNGTLTSAQLSAWSAAQNTREDVFVNGVGFTAGVTTALTLSAAPGNTANIRIVRTTSGAPVTYTSDQYSIVGTTLTFGSAIPASTTRVEVRYLLTYQVNTVDSDNATWNAAFAGAVARSVRDRLREKISVKDFGAQGDGVTDDTAAIVAGKAAAILANASLDFPATSANVYLTSLPLTYTTAANITCAPGVRIKLTAAAAHVLCIDGSAGGGSWLYGSDISGGLILDGAGFCADGLRLINVVNGTFEDIRVTNVTSAGFRLGWAQLCVFINPTCSRNVELFTTTPVYGLLVDGAASSAANTIINPTMEWVSGTGIKLLSLINSIIITGTSEGNPIALELGESPSVGRVCLGNTFLVMDIEVNSVADIILRETADANNFFGMRSASTVTPGVQFLGATRNNWSGGSSSGFLLDANSSNNHTEGATMYGAGATYSDLGTNNTNRNIFNVSTVAITPDKEMRRRVNNVPANGATVPVNCATTRSVSITCGAGVSGITVGIPTNPIDGATLDVTIHNNSGGTLVTTWSPALFGFATTGWNDPADGFIRSASFVYDANYGYWYPKGMSMDATSLGGPLSAYAAGAFGLSAGADMAALVAKVAAMDVALKKNGIGV